MRSGGTPCEGRRPGKALALLGPGAFRAGGRDLWCLGTRMVVIAGDLARGAISEADLWRLRREGKKYC